MSRYTVPCDTFGPEAGEAVVGWDARRRTYFARTYDYEATDDSATYAIGLTPGEIPTVVDLIRESYALCEIDDDTIAALLDDPASKTPATRRAWASSPSGPTRGSGLRSPAPALVTPCRPNGCVG